VSKKNEIKPWLREQWCIPPEANAEFVAAMEDVLDVYHRPQDEGRPVVCIDEASRQLIGETVQPIPAAPGQPERVDYEHVRNGTANLFMIFAPLTGFRSVWLTERRTALDFAEVLRWLAEEAFADAEKVVLVCDNLNTHKAACLYEAFPPEQARRIAEKLEWHYTPKHGSWSNMAEIELSVLSRQCLGRRIESIEEMESEVQAWQDDRNDREVGVKWRFTTADARVKLSKLYPTT
jgi:DDE superfamily endonuclease